MNCIRCNEVISSDEMPKDKYAARLLDGWVCKSCSQPWKIGVDLGDKA